MTQTYKRLDKFLRDGRDPNYRRVPSKRETYVSRDAYGHIRVYYRHTPVVTALADKRVIILQTGGWYTPTTKARMNEWLDPAEATVYQDKFQWYVSSAGGRTERYNDEFGRGTTLATKAHEHVLILPAEVLVCDECFEVANDNGVHPCTLCGNTNFERRED